MQNQLQQDTDRMSIVRSLMAIVEFRQEVSRLFDVRVFKPSHHVRLLFPDVDRLDQLHLALKQTAT